MNKEEQLKAENDFYDSVVELPKGKLPERIFKDYFLPYFIGDKVIPDDNSVIDNWISVAGGMTNKVDILGDNGEVVYTVPALVDTSYVGVRQQNKISIYDMLATATQKNERIVNSGDEILTIAEDEVSKISHSSELEQFWIMIYKRYNLLIEDSDVEISDEEDYLEYE